MRIRREPHAIATLPAGTYYVGDPCYLIPDPHYEPWIAKAEVHTDDEDVLAAEIGGYPIAACGTEADGVYIDNDGREYGVDSGLVGVVPQAFAVKDDADIVDLVHLIQFDTDFDVHTAGENTIRMGHITITVEDGEDDD